MKRFVRLGDIATVSAGQGAPQGAENYSKTGIPFIKAGDLIDLVNGKSEDCIQKVSNKVATKYKLKLYPEKSIVFAKSGMSCMKGYVYALQSNCYVVNHLACVSPNKEIDYRYLKYYFDYHRPNQLVKDSAYPSISLSDISNMQIAVFDMSAQTKIVNTLVRADVLIAKRKQQLALLDALVKSRFVELFGDITINDKNWDCYPLGKLCTIVRGGSPRPIDKFLGGNIPWIKIGDATDGENIYLHSTKEHIIPEGVNKSRLIKAGSLIFANCGVSLGFARIITFDGCIHDGWLALENIDSRLDKIFLLQTLNQMTEHFRKIAPSGTQPNLNTAIMKAYMQIVPPMELQQKFISFVSRVDGVKGSVEKSLQELETLKQSLLQQYFS